MDDDVPDLVGRPWPAESKSLRPVQNVRGNSSDCAHWRGLVPYPYPLRAFEHDFRVKAVRAWWRPRVAVPLEVEVRHHTTVGGLVAVDTAAPLTFAHLLPG